MLTIINSDSFYTTTLALTPVGSLGNSIPIANTRFTLINSCKTYTSHTFPVTIGSIGSPIPAAPITDAVVISSSSTYTATITPIVVSKLGAQLSNPIFKSIVINSSKTYWTTQLSKNPVSFIGRSIASNPYSLVIINTLHAYKVLQTPIAVSTLGRITTGTPSKVVLLNSNFYSSILDGITVGSLGTVLVSVRKSVIVNSNSVYSTYSLIEEVVASLGSILPGRPSRLLTIQSLKTYTALQDNVSVTSMGEVIFSFSKFILKLVNNAKYYSARIPAVSLGYPAPVIIGFSLPTTSNNLTIPIDFTYNGVIREHALSILPDLADCLWVRGLPTSYTFDEPRQCKYLDKTVYLAVKNNYESISDIAHAKTQLYLPDTVSPTINAFTSVVDDSWVVKLTVDVTDNIGVSRYCVTEDNVDLLPTDARFKRTKPTTYTFITIGEKTLYLMVRDAANNISKASINFTILPDTISPVINSFNIVYKLNSLIVDLEIDAYDARGIVAYNISETLVKSPTWHSIKPTTYRYKTSGDKQLYLWARDEAGNISEYAMDTCSLQSTLTGSEQLNQQLTIEAISLDAIKTYISDPVIGSQSGPVQSESSIIQLIAGESIGGHRVVSQVNGIAYYASNTTLGIIMGISIDAASKDDIVNIQFKDILTEPSWNWNMGLPVFIGVNGLLTQVVPETGYLQVIATPLSSKSLMINIQEPIQL